MYREISMVKQLIKKMYRKIYLREFSKKLNLPTEKEKTLIDELVNDFQKISIIDTKDLSGATLTWAYNMNRLRELIFNDDPRRFLQWDVIRETMFAGNARYVLKELESLRNQNIFEEYWKKGIIESEVGSPSRCHWFKNSSGNLIHHAYHLQQFEEKTNIALNTIDFVFEFGGGYGSICRLFNNLGFNNKYVIFDLPSFSLLQKYYLKSLGYRLLTVNEFCCERSGILCISDFEELKDVLKITISVKRKLFIGTWSISETSIDLRNSIFSLLGNFNLFLLTYQDKFKEVDNIDYFKNIQKNYSSVKWDNWKIEHIPGSNYLIGNGI